MFAGIWLLASNSLGAAIIEEGDEVRVPYQGSSPLLGFALVLERTFGLAVNMVGIFGWLDAPVPLAVQFVWAATTGALLLLGVTLLRGRERIVAIILVLGVVLLPAVFQGAYIHGGGYIWQGRYTLPAFVCLLVGLAALVADRLGEGLTRERGTRLAVTVLVVWAIAHLYAFVTALKRYAVGDSNTWVDLLRDPSWVPPGGLVPIIGGFAVVVGALAAGGILLARSAERAPAEHDPEDDDAGEQPRSRPGEGRERHA